MVRAWYINEEEVALDQRNPSMTTDSVSLKQLKDIGVDYFEVDAEKYETCEFYAELKKQRGYSYSDQITVSKETLPNYDEKIKSFFKEHLHLDEEIRFALDGSGYFDVRDSNDKWIRIEMVRNDLIVLPAGIYHRFTLDHHNYIKVIRLFVGEPVWTPHNRPADDKPERKKYLENFISSPDN